MWVCLSPLHYETSMYEKREDYSAIVLSMVVDYSIHFSKVSQTMRQNQAPLCLWGECRQAIVLCGVQKWHVVLIFTPTLLLRDWYTNISYMKQDHLRMNIE